MASSNIKFTAILIGILGLCSCDAERHLLNNMSMKPTHGDAIFKKTATVKEDEVPLELNKYKQETNIFNGKQ